jgi:proliferating cell nuclear antigen PCNA
MGKFRCLISRSLHFKNIINSMKEMTDFVNFECNNDGIYIQGMDSAKISLMDLNLNREYFEEFEMEDEEEMVVLGMNMKILSAILKCVDSSDEIEFESEGDNDKVSITLKNDNKKNIFEMNLTEIEQENMDVPEMDHEYIFMAEPKEIVKYISNMNALEVADVIFNLKKGIISMRGKSDNVSMNFELVNDNNEGDLQDNTKINLIKSIDEETEMTFSLTYLQKFMKASPLSKKVAFSFTNGVPMFVQFQFEGGNLNYYLAPKIDDED